MNNQRETNSFEQEVERILLDYIREQNNASDTNAYRNMITNNLTTPQLNAIINAMTTYNRNIRIYNENMQQYLSMLQNNRPSRNTPRRYTNAFNILGSLFPPMRNTQSESQFQPLTANEINRATTTLLYNSGLNETRCPISWDDFIESEQICKINRCGHIFKKNALMQWFSQNNHCPVCRCDVLQTNNNTSEIINQNANDISNNYENIQPAVNEGISNTTKISPNTHVNNIFTTLLNNLFPNIIENSSVIEQPLIIDIPIYYDLSGESVYFDISMNRNI